MAFELLVIVLLILLNGVLAMSEIALVSARKVRLQHWAEAGSEQARAALALAEEPTRFLSTIQVGITLVGILAGAFGGATIAERLAVYLAIFPALAPYSQGISLALVVAVITYLTLILGELVPKRLGLNNPERIAAAVARPMRALSAAVHPVVRFLSLSTDFVFRLLRVKQPTEPSVTEEEVRIMVEQGARMGIFEEMERELVEGVFRLGGRRVSALMTPRPDLVWLDVQDAPELSRREIARTLHSHYPVGDGSLDQLLGVVRARDLLAQCMEGRAFDLRQALQHPFFIPETTLAVNAFELFKQSGVDAALIVDEYGEIQGMLTLNGILESIVGSVPLSRDLGEAQAVQREDGSWLLDGMLLMDDFEAIFRTRKLAEGGGFQTLGGFVMSQLGRVPQVGQHFTWEGLRFEVVDMDDHRVDRVLVTPPREEGTG
ncbi:MAG: hemolysin family protein [Pseudomonadota bacterium]